MIQSRIVETLDEKTNTYRESVEAAFENVQVSFYLAGNTESRALVAALESVQSCKVNAAAPQPAPAAVDRWSKPPTRDPSQEA